MTKNLIDGGGGGDVFEKRPVGGVEEVDVDAVTVIGGADRGDGADCVGDFAPGAAGHGAGVVD